MARRIWARRPAEKADGREVGVRAMQEQLPSLLAVNEYFFSGLIDAGASKVIYEDSIANGCEEKTFHCPLVVRRKSAL